jgi:FlaA1/EpsC-like NDP-sugar epimerase/lipopolysaccharide/colanic/teichoic acid biosynthesis glycosyltransferase
MTSKKAATWQMIAKRMLDVIVAGLVLIIAAPLLVTLSVLVATFLGRPVIFSQERPGLHGKLFRIYKFRTMTDGRDSDGQLLPDGQRLTRFGRLLRSSSLDELPGLINVLRGDMSLVGPRPLPAQYLPIYDAEQSRRHDVKPGVTGWTQINGRNAISWQTKFALDLWYVDNWTLWLDLKILFVTVLRVVQASGISQPGHATVEPFTGALPSGSSTDPATLLKRRPAARVLFALADAAAWAASLGLVTWTRYAFDHTLISNSGLLLTIVFAVLAQWLIGIVAHTYRGRYLLGSADEAINLAKVMLLAGLVVLGVDFATTPVWVPRSVPLSAALTALVMAGGLRLAVRRVRERTERPDESSAQRVIIFGSSTSGQQLLRSMLSDPAGGYLPVALLDDDPQWRRLRVSGVPVLGTRDDIAAVAQKAGASLLVIAVRNVDAADLRDVTRRATEAGLAVKVLPSFSEVFHPWVGLSDLRDPDIADLLGRRQIDTDIAAIAEYLVGKRVLVTGAGGSIGAELCRQIHQFGPAELMMLDRDESALHALQLSIQGSALLTSPDIILADIRDAEVVQAIFDDRKPQVVFHAAALKHLPMLEQYPKEAWKTNVVGTANVLAAAWSVRVERFVNISDSKAANPVSALGRSKRIGERLVAAMDLDDQSSFVSVRFSNVLGSRGSVLTTFAEQLAKSLPVTVTDPMVTRYLMTIPEAVKLVIQAAAIGASGETLVLDMGAPVRIVDVARELMAIAGRPTPIVYTGLRPGEKLHEELFSDGEDPDHRPWHPAISHVTVPPLDSADLYATARAIGPTAALRKLTATPEVPQYRKDQRIPSPSKPPIARSGQS